MTLKRIGDFATGDPVRLDRDLSQFEANVSAEFELSRREQTPQLRVVNFTPSASRGIVAIRPDQQLTVDTGFANGAVVFPEVIPANFGRRFVLIKRASAYSIVTSCQDSAVLCNGGPMPTITAIGVTVFYCDSSGYYR